MRLFILILTWTTCGVTGCLSTGTGPMGSSPSSMTSPSEAPNGDTTFAAGEGGEIGPKADKEGIITAPPEGAPTDPRDATHGFVGDGDGQGGSIPAPSPSQADPSDPKNPNVD